MQDGGPQLWRRFQINGIQCGSHQCPATLRRRRQCEGRLVGRLPQGQLRRQTLKASHHRQYPGSNDVDVPAVDRQASQRRHRRAPHHGAYCWHHCFPGEMLLQHLNHPTDRLRRSGPECRKSLQPRCRERAVVPGVARIVGMLQPAQQSVHCAVGGSPPPVPHQSHSPRYTLKHEVVRQVREGMRAWPALGSGSCEFIMKVQQQLQPVPIVRLSSSHGNSDSGVGAHAAVQLVVGHSFPQRPSARHGEWQMCQCRRCRRLLYHLLALLELVGPHDQGLLQPHGGEPLLGGVHHHVIHRHPRHHLVLFIKRLEVIVRLPLAAGPAAPGTGACRHLQPL
mmetsp:Transcript_7568/g.22340  ORF Transcript_7568/g.22340 Transcript_7568/m.22340 type:complete len:337 (-) Transcript_7568:1292-2302(-)